MAGIGKYISKVMKKISTKVVVIVLVAGVIPCLIFVSSLFGFSRKFPVMLKRTIEQMQTAVFQQTEDMNLRQAEKYVRAKAKDVAALLDLYLRVYPEKTTEDLRKDIRFRELAVRSIGRRGYTAVYDVERGVIYFHKSEYFEGFNMLASKGELPLLWDIINASKGGRRASGFYDWKDHKGRVQKKYVYVCPLKEKTADGIRFAVAATYGSDEFKIPVRVTEELIRQNDEALIRTTRNSVQYFIRRSIFFMFLGLVAVVTIAVGVGIYFSHSIAKLRRATQAIIEGDFSVRLDPGTEDDVGELIQAFNHMASCLTDTTVRKEEIEHSERKLKKINAELRREITSREIAESTLRESEIRFRDLAELLPQVVFEVDREGRFVFVNQNWFDFFGYRREDLERGMTFYQMIVGSEGVGGKEYIERKLRDPSRGDEYMMRKKDGSLLPVKIYCATIRQEYNVAGLRGIIIDITNTKKAQEDLERAYHQLQETQQELIQSSKMSAMGQLAAGVSHELNQPLTGIKGFAQMILLDLKESDPLRKDVEKIVTQADRIDKIIKHVRFFSRKAEFKMEEIDVNVPLEDAVMLLGEQIKLHNIRMNKTLTPGLPFIEGDSNQLEQVFINLITNSRDAMDSPDRPEGGELNIISRFNTDKNCVEVVFSDTGCGIEKDQQQHIFNPFFTTKAPNGGVGLGLSIVYRIIQTHKGTIRVDSEQGKGTTFTILLPVKA